MLSRVATPSAADSLIARLRERAADPVRRVDVRPNTLAMGGQLLDLGGMLRGPGGIASLLTQLRGDLARLQDPARAPEVTAKVERMMTGMTPPPPAPLPGPADEATVARAEAVVGPLPPLLRRVYREIADGGFGPGYGLLPLATVATTYRSLRDTPPGPPGAAWPDALVPFVEEDGDYTAVDRTTGRVIGYDGEELLEEWDPDDPDEAAAERGWKRCFSETAPSVEAWLGRWLDTPTVAERMAEEVKAMQADPMAIHRKNMRESMDRYAAMTADERRKHISDEVWEQLKRSNADLG